MKKFVFTAFALLLAGGAGAQNKISVGIDQPFDVIESNGKIELFVTIDPSRPASMDIDMNGNDHNLLNWEVREGTLHMKYPPKNKSLPVIIRLNCHRLSGLTLSASSVTVETAWEAPMVTIGMSSYAKLTAGIRCKDIRAITQTNSTAILRGAAKYADFDARSKSQLDARDFEAVSLTLRATGFSESFVYGSERMIIESWDGASVFYRGEPEIFRKREGRGGTINSIGD